MFNFFCYFIFFVVFVFLTKVNGEYRYDYSYNKEVKGWLKLHRMPATFKDAFIRCNLEDAVLASPLNAQLQNVMIEMQEASNVNCGIFTGIHATISKGDFTSIEGIPLTKIPLTWAPDEPNNYENQEDCIIMLWDGAVADARCNDTYPYVCYRKKTTNPVITACGTVDTGYSLNQRTGSCYKFHHVGKTWRRAQSTCLAEGGHLAIINSFEEAIILKDLFAKHPAASIKSPYPNSVSVGYLDWDKNGVWYTVNGQSLEEAGYSSWLSGQPNNEKQIDGGQYCGSIYRQGQLDDVWCETVPFAFICEKTPDSLVFNDLE